MTSVEQVFLDTNILVAASVPEHPSHAIATVVVARLAERDAATYISPQVCREFMATMTRAPFRMTLIEPSKAVDVLGGWLAGCDLLPETAEVVATLKQIVVRKGVRGKQVHDANVVATMLANGVTRLATLDEADFRRYEDAIALEPVAS
jgi:predicted nucleic acid-binding protein